MVSFNGRPIDMPRLFKDESRILQGVVVVLQRHVIDGPFAVLVAVELVLASFARLWFVCAMAQCYVHLTVVNCPSTPNK
jgi:hypothetical protein